MTIFRVGLNRSLVRRMASLPRSNVRSVQTECIPVAKSAHILNEQRVKRPSSPHFTIYQIQLNMYSSLAHRVAGVPLSILLYGLSLGYLIGPGTFDSQHILELVSSLPEGVKYTGKAVLAAPFAYHSWNGVKHLVWDTGKYMTVAGMYRTTYVVFGLTAASTCGLLLL